MLTNEQSLTARQHHMVSLFTGLAILPHVMHLPVPVSLFLLLLLIWRFSALHYPRLEPGRWLLVLLTFSGIFLVFSRFQTLIGRDAGVALLSVMMMLKTLEVKKRRDLYNAVFISYFVVITHFLFDQSIPMVLYLSLIMICLTALLIEINRVKPSQHGYQTFLQTAVITFQALPIAIVLFLIFPRLTHPLWSLGIGNSSMTGLSDRVSPGQFSQLVESPEVAFRVSFDRQPPEAELRYWRGLVIWDTDGKSWYNRVETKNQPLKIDERGNVSYEVFLEAHQKNWLYALDLPIKTDKTTTITPDFLLRSQHPIRQSIRYRVWSTTEKQNRIFPPGMRERALELPDNVSQRQFELVDQWRAKTTDPREIITLALSHFNQQPYVYTLNPPQYIDNPIDEFLFEGREGFCEHYATAFAQLMRVAGIPSRLVLGYQGGEYNEMGDYFIIRQYDAHAWTEVWLDDTGWLRIDPTAAVAPERIRYQIRSEFGEQGSPVMFRLESSGFVGSTLRSFAHMLDNANVQWRRWVIGYSREHQFSLMRDFGFDSLSPFRWALITTLMISVPLLLVTIRLVLAGRKKSSPDIHAYHLFCKRLARLGITREIQEGPMEYAARAIKIRQDLTAPISRITALYIKVRYGPKPDKQQIQALVKQVRQFHPGRHKS